MIANLLSGAGGVVLGTILGFLLTLGATGWQKGREKKEQRDAVVMLLRIEIDQNLAMLKAYQEKATTDLPSETSAQYYQMRSRYLEDPPQWRHQRWESLTPLLAATLNEHEIKEVDTFHAGLEALTDRLSKVQRLNPEEVLEKIPADTRHIIFSKAVEQALEQCQGYREMIDNLLRAKKPLEAPAPANTKPNLLVHLKGRLPGKRQHKQP